MPTNQSLPVNLTLSTDPTPTLVTTVATLVQMPVVKPVTAIAKCIPVTVCNLAQGKFKEIPYPVRKSQEEEGPSTPSSYNPLVEQQPKAAATAKQKEPPWPNTMSASNNLFVERASWPIPL